MTVATKSTTITRFDVAGEELTIPVARIVGRRSGPRFGVSAGMHGGEMVGTRAALRLLDTIDPDELEGELLILPIISPRAMFEHAIQLSPVDDREVHAQPPGAPGTSYSHFLADRVFQLLKGVDYHVDMHSGECIQPLDPWISVPDGGTEAVQQATWALASCFPVRYLDARRHRTASGALTAMGHPQPDGTVDVGAGLPGALLDAGIPNIWTEIGPNGRQDEESIAMQVHGVYNALRFFGLLPGSPTGIPSQLVVGPRRSRPLAARSGYWRPYIQAGDAVLPGQVLGRLFDLDGELIETYVSELTGVVQYVFSSPAIDALRVPHGNTWHQGLYAIVEVHPSGALDPRLQWTIGRGQGSLDLHAGSDTGDRPCHSLTRWMPETPSSSIRALKPRGSAQAHGGSRWWRNPRSGPCCWDGPPASRRSRTTTPMLPSCSRSSRGASRSAWMTWTRLRPGPEWSPSPFADRCTACG